MIFEQIPVGNMQNFAYIVGNRGECAVIDPGWDADIILKKADELKLKIRKIVLTHTHFDHTNDINLLFKKTDAVIYVHYLEADNIRKINPKMRIKELKDGDIIKIGGLNGKVIHTPGHTPGCICVLFGNKLLTGDTLFVDSIGRTDFPESSPEDMKKSIEKLKGLGDDIEIWPGHDYGVKKSSTIGEEKRSNPFLK